MCWGVGEVRGDVGKCWGRCGKVCWGVGEISGDGGVWGSVGGGAEKCVGVYGR